MNPKKNKLNRKPQNNKQPERFQPKVLFIWLIIFAAIIGLWSLYPVQDAKQKVWTLQQVSDEAQAGNIERAILKPDPTGGLEWYIIKGQLKSKTKEVVDGKEVEMPIYFTAEGRLTGTQFDNLLNSKSGSVITQKKEGSFLTNLLTGLIPFLVIIGILYFLFARQIRNAGRGAMSFGKSRAKMLTRDDKIATFNDVAGCDEAKEEVSEIVDFLRDPKKFQRIGGKVPKGVLMMGPPGTGKTLLARAVAGEADVPFFTISGSDFVEMFVGVGASRVRDMFEQGRQNAPCIIFIDEIDAVGRQRGAGLGGGNDEREQTLNSLLVEMDGFDSHEGVIVIAATNRPDVLDSALLRPGRFDRQVVIDLPDIHGREEILQVHAKDIKMRDNIDLSVVARSTPGFSGADLENLLNEAALIAARFDKDMVDMQDIDDARDKIAYGRERRRLMDDEDKKITAYHEAGHALIQVAIDDNYLPVHKVTIIPRGQSLGSTMFIPKKDILNQQKQRVLNQICCAMGGRIAEELAIGDITSGASGDIKMATKLARHMICDWGMSSLGLVALGENQDHIFLGKEITRTQNYSEQTAELIDKEMHDIVNSQYLRGRKIIENHRKALDIIAQALLEYETIEGKHVKEIFEFGEIKSPVIAFRYKAHTESDKTGKKSGKVAKKQSVNPGDVSVESAIS